MEANPKKVSFWKTWKQFSNLVTFNTYIMSLKAFRCENIACWNVVGSIIHLIFIISKIPHKKCLFKENIILIFKFNDLWYSEHVNTIKINWECHFWLILVTFFALNTVFWGWSTKNVQFTPENQFFEFSLLCAWITRISKEADLIPIGYGLSC